MGIFTKDIKTMDDLLIHGLQDIYYAEQQITKALPKMIDKATNRDLVTGLKNHLEETNKQIERLQKVFEKLGREPSGAQCPAIDGIIREADETAGEIEDKAVSGRRHRRECAGGRALRNLPVRDTDCLGRGARPRRDRTLPHHQPERREGGEYQTQYGGAAQGRECQGLQLQRRLRRVSRP